MSSDDYALDTDAPLCYLFNMPRESLTIRCTPGEAQAIRSAARKARRTTSDWVISAVLEHILGTKRTRAQLQQMLERVKETKSKP